MRRKNGVLAASALVVAGVIVLVAALSESEQRKKIVETAQSFKGVPYVYGAESPEAFDCSGFVQYVYSHAAGIVLPRNSKGQWAGGKSIGKEEAKPGDLFLFDTAGSGGPSHVAIYLGDDSIIHAVSEGPKTGIIVSSVNDRYFAPRFIGARNFILPSSSVATSEGNAPTPIASQLEKVEQGEMAVDQVGFTVTSTPSVVMDKIPAAAGSAIAFTITNGTGSDAVFHVVFYKASVDFSKIRILREDRAPIRSGASVEIPSYAFLESGIYRLNVKTSDNTQLMQRTWKVIGAKP
jgi:hypothetical protein